MGNLQIIKASAGSGKTYKLTLEYIKLLYKNEYSYKNILAVTFTNKATEEMKSRIILELKKLAKNTTESDYFDTLKKEFNLNQEQIKAKADRILINILHDYSKFSVSTIDKFFQKILKSFAKEINLQAGFSVELNTTEVLNEVIEELINNIENDETLKSWIVKFIENKVTNEGKVNIKDEIASLGKEVFKESFQAFDKSFSSKINDKNYLNTYKKELQEIKIELEKEVKEYAKNALQIAKDSNLEIVDFKGGNRGFFNHFNKVLAGNFEPTATVLKSIDNVEQWHKKNDVNEIAILSVYNAGANKMLRNCVEFYEQKYPIYNSVNIVLNNFFALGIITDILDLIRKYVNENNLFLISDTAKFINLIIADNDAPFIYEKIGNIYENYMIDEFQDTSSLQYSNFKPLIDNTLSQNQSNNIVVGDVKQAIYRWRNSNWNLLANQIENDFKHSGAKAESLEFNWRSDKNIVEFNNVIFNQYPEILQNQFNNLAELDEYSGIIKNAYLDSFQKTSPKKEVDSGYININFIEEKNLSNFRERAVESLPEIIENLQDKNYEPRDIAILIRTKKEGKLVADFLLNYKNSGNASSKYNYDIISNESLFINNSGAVKFLIHYLKFIINPQDYISKAYIVKYYQENVAQQNVGTHDILKSVKTDNDFYNLLPNGANKIVDLSKTLPIYELFERIISDFKINTIKTEMPFVIAFLDLISDFVAKENSDLHTFIEWWETKGIDKTISVSDLQNAIKIITIHKSKGLEFPAVIIPFANWTVDNDRIKPILWCKPTSEPFNKMDVLPVRYDKKLANSIFANDYYTEMIKTYVDNLNILYVAQTRAENALYIIARDFPIKDKIKEIGQGLKKISINNFKDNYSEDENKLEISNLINKLQKEKTQDNSVVISNFISTPINKSKLVFKHTSKDLLSYNKNQIKINKGTLYHQILEDIITVNDVERAVKKAVLKGFIKEEKLDSFVNEITEFINYNDETKSWFDKENIIKNELEILTENVKTKRPDRVIINTNSVIVVDYKFGEIEKSSYIVQVKEYKEFLQKMEYKNVFGKIWYVNKNKIVTV